MYVIIHGDIGDIDYLSVAGPFASEAEAMREGEQLEAEGKLPNEADLGEVAWRVEKLVPPDSMAADYLEDEDEEN